VKYGAINLGFLSFVRRLEGMAFLYKMVQVPRTLVTTSKNRDTMAAEYLESISNEHGRQGWEFHSVNEMHTVTPPGCLAALFGAKEVYLIYSVIVFRKPTL